MARQGSAAGRTAAWLAPLTFSNVAWIDALPSPTAVTRPDAETVATAVFDDDHVAVVVTISILPSDIVATAVYCDDAPTAGALPVTVTVDTTVGEVAELHALANTPNARTIAMALPTVHACTFRLATTRLNIFSPFHRSAVRWLLQVQTGG